jgi:hypothetical protein
MLGALSEGTFEYPDFFKMAAIVAISIGSALAAMKRFPSAPDAVMAFTCRRATSRTSIIPMATSGIIGRSS